MNYGMRCHDLCPKTDIDTLVNTIAANHVDQIQLAMGKSIAGYNFDQWSLFAWICTDDQKKTG